MLLKIFLKIWPALIPIALFIIYKLIIIKLINRLKNKNKTIEGEKVIGNSSTESQPKNSQKLFNLNDKNLIITLYLSVIIMILCLMILAFN